MRIAFVITRADDLGGAQVHVRDISTALRDIGHEVVVLGGSDGILGDELRQRGIRFCSLRHLVRPISPMRDLLAAWEIRRALSDIRPDVVSTHSSKAGILGRVAGRSLGIPTMFTAHGWAFAEGKSRQKRALYRLIERAAAPLATRIITVCEAERDFAIKHRVAGPDKVVAVHNAVLDVDETLRAEPAKSPPRLVVVARFDRQKDHPTLFRALAGLLDLEWQLALVGGGPLRSKAESLAAEMSLSSRVSFLGLRKDVTDLLAQSQAFLLITNWEGFPRSILEAMRAGLPVVASDVGGVSESVVDRETGFVIPRGDWVRLRSRLGVLLTDAELRARMGAAGRARYESRFPFPHLVSRTLAVYEEPHPLRTNGRRTGPVETPKHRPLPFSRR